MEGNVLKYYHKHWNLPIPDQYLECEIDAGKRLLRITIGDHLDTALLVGFCQNLEDERGIVLVDRKSKDSWGRAHIPELYDIELSFAGILFDVQLMQMLDLSEGKAAPGKVTACLKRRS